MSLPAVDEPPRPRMGGRAALLVAVLGFLGALAIFGLVLVMLGVIRTPLHKGEPAPITSTAPIQLPKSARFAEQHDCLQNIGTTEQPNMIIVECGPGTLEVLERLEGTTDYHQCEKVSEYRYYYFYDSDLGDSLDFVLCMRKRP